MAVRLCHHYLEEYGSHESCTPTLKSHIKLRHQKRPDCWTYRLGEMSSAPQHLCLFLNDHRTTLSDNGTTGKTTPTSLTRRSTCLGSSNPCQDPAATRWVRKRSVSTGGVNGSKEVFQDQQNLEPHGKVCKMERDDECRPFLRFDNSVPSTRGMGGGMMDIATLHLSP